MLKCGRQASCLLPAIAEHQDLASLIRKSLVLLLRGLLGELRLDQCGEGLLALGAEVGDPATLPRGWRLAHRAAREARLTIAGRGQRYPKRPHLLVREHVLAIQVARAEVYPDLLGHVLIARLGRQQLDLLERALGLAPQEADRSDVFVRVGEEVGAAAVPARR